MLAKVISKDESIIYNGMIYGYDDEFEVDEAIGKSLIERGLIEGETEDEVDDIDEMSYPELKSYASELGLSASGKKDELIARIKEHLANAEETEDEETEDEEIPNTSMPE